MVLTVLGDIGIAVGGYAVGHFGLPLVISFFRNLSAKRAIAAAQKVASQAEANAKALVAKAEAQAKQLADAKALLTNLGVQP